MIPSGGSAGTSGLDVVRVTILSIDGRGTAETRDTLGKERQIRYDLRAKGNGVPAQGEIWLAQRIPDSSSWMLVAQVGAGEPPAVTGAWMDTSPAGKSLLAALVGMGLVVDQSTVTPSPHSGSALIELKPTGPSDNGQSSTWSQWFQAGTVTVPSWATWATYRVDLAGAYAVAATTGLDWRLTVGSAVANARSTTALVQSGTPRYDYSWAGSIGGMTSGDQPVVIQYQRTSGSGAMRIDSGSLITVTLTWIPT